MSKLLLPQSLIELLASIEATAPVPRFPTALNCGEIVSPAGFEGIEVNAADKLLPLLTTGGLFERLKAIDRLPPAQTMAEFISGKEISYDHLQNEFPEGIRLIGDEENMLIEQGDLLAVMKLLAKFKVAGEQKLNSHWIMPSAKNTVSVTAMPAMRKTNKITATGFPDNFITDGVFGLDSGASALSSNMRKRATNDAHSVIRELGLDIATVVLQYRSDNRFEVIDVETELDDRAIPFLDHILSYAMID